tara:strand:+ start:97 stop:315 length:219 start_codon:yes stop_codon:yes gene_type:complete
MCFFSSKPPKLPEPVETPPKPEKTAERVVLGQKRTSVDKPKTSKRKNIVRSLGTSSLRIPLATGRGSGNLNY